MNNKSLARNFSLRHLYYQWILADIFHLKITT